MGLRAIPLGRYEELTSLVNAILELKEGGRELGEEGGRESERENVDSDPNNQYSRLLALIW